MPTDDPDDRYDDARDRPRDGYDRPAASGAAARARGRVGIPAIFLVLNGLAGLGFAAAMFYFLVVAPDKAVDELKQLVAAQPPGPDKQKLEKLTEEMEETLKLDSTPTVVQLAISAVLNAVAVFGALRMRAMGSYGWAMAASIVSLIPLATGFCCTGMPFGLWGLIVLMNPDVKAGFVTARGVIGERY